MNLGTGPRITLREVRHGITWSPSAYSIGNVESDPETGCRVYGRSGSGGGYRRATQSADEVLTMAAEAIAAYEEKVCQVT
jgi:hypothetical protein